MTELQPPIEWTEEAKPFAVCMNCSAEYPDTETVCPKCNIKLLVVHRCPKCTRIAALKHLRCPYCAWRFVKVEELESALEPGVEAAETPQKAQHRAVEQRRRRKILIFSLACFAVVFAAAAWIIHSRSSHSSIPSVIGSSYSLKSVDVRHAASDQAYPLGKLGQGKIVEITGVEQDERASDWYQIRYQDRVGYVRVNEVAPPKGMSADAAYQLLKASLADLTDSSEAGDAGQAVDLFRRTYPADARGQELLWLLAGRMHELARSGRSRNAVLVARKAYQELAAGNGEYAARAREAMQQLPEPSGTHVSQNKREEADLEIIGASNVGPSSQQALPHKMMLLNQTRVLVNLPNAGQFQTGQVLTAHIANDVITNNEVAIPGGSACTVKVTATANSSGAPGWVALKLQSVQLGQRTYAVDAAPVQLSLTDAQVKSGAPVLFRLRRSLVLTR